MKLYNENRSPFCCRVRVQIYYKMLPIEMTPIPGGRGSAEYLALTPLGKVPALQLNDRVLAESLAIMEYLEDRYPRTPLRPENIEQRAQMRTINQVNDHNTMPAVTRLFMLFTRGCTPDERQQANAELSTKLSQIEALLGKQRYAVGESMSLADCCLFPTVHYAVTLRGLLGLDAELADLPRLQTWWNTVIAEAAVQRVREEIDAAMRAMTN